MDNMHVLIDRNPQLSNSKIEGRNGHQRHFLMVAIQNKLPERCACNKSQFHTPMALICQTQLSPN
jgi:hypothetical protein